MFPWLTTYVSTRKLPGRRNLKDVEYYTLFQLSTWGLRYDALALQWLIGEQTMAAGRRMLDQQEVPSLDGIGRSSPEGQQLNTDSPRES